MLCSDIAQPFFLIFSKDASPLLYYSHIPTAIIALLIGLFVYFKSKKALAGKLLLFTAGAFFFWSFLDLILWTNVDPKRMTFVWSLINLVEMLVSVATFHFSYVFIEQKDVAFKYKIFIAVLLLLFASFIATVFNIPAFDLVNCEVEQGMLVYYFYALETLFLLWFGIYLIKSIIKSKGERRKIISLYSAGAFLFLFLFSGLNLLGSFTEQWNLVQYGMFGMPIFMALLSYLIIQYRVFNIQLLKAQALWVALMILTGSQFFFIQMPTNRLLTAITLVLVAIFGRSLVNSVKKEIARQEELIVLTASLEKANLRLKELDQQKTEFLSIASHQLRTPLSIFKGYFELIEDGAYGPPSLELRKVLGDMDMSNERLVKLVDEFLDISRLEQGRTKYVFAKTDFTNLLQSVFNELKERAHAKGLELVYKKPIGAFKINADEEKIRHVIFNFVDNAIKYSDHGKIIIFLKKEKNSMSVVVSDKGLGFDKVDQANFFQKFYRGNNVNGININGTGLGLYVCRRFIEKHKGKIWAKSSGLGKGSEFGFKIPTNITAKTVVEE